MSLVLTGVKRSLSVHQIFFKMLLVLVALLFSGVGAFVEDCEEYCERNETCCPGPTSEVLCCPFANGTCCDDFENCCPEGSFCDMRLKMCGSYFIPKLMKRSGDFENEDIRTDSTQHEHVRRDTNEITKMDQMLVHCDQDQFCPYFSTCCRTKDNLSLCCPNPEGVCCDDEQHCCKQGEECDSQGDFCISEVGMEIIVREADDLMIHYEKRGLDFVEPDVIKGNPSNNLQESRSD